MWELEFRKIRSGEWSLFTRGSLEECLEDALALKTGQHGWGATYDAARLGFTRDERPGEPVPPGRDRPSRAVVEDGVIRDVTLHQHTWSEDLDRMVWRCPCGATVTWEEVHRAGQAASPDLLGRIWAEKQQ